MDGIYDSGNYEIKITVNDDNNNIAEDYFSILTYKTFGDSAADTPEAMYVDDNGYVYIAGYSQSDLDNEWSNKAIFI